VFTGHVWRDLFKMGGVKLHMSTQHFTRRQMASPRWSTRSSLCTCAVSRGIDLAPGWIGCRGRNTVTTHLSTQLFVPPCSRSSTVALPRQCCPTHPEQHVQRPWMLFFLSRRGPR
jgi:hypothetical protein